MKVSFNKGSINTPNTAEQLQRGAGNPPDIDVEATPVTEAEPAQPATPVIDATPVADIPTQSASEPKYEVPATRELPSFDDENIGFSDIILPKIHIVQKVGDLSNIYNGGEIILNKVMAIHTPAVPEKKQEGNKPLLLTVLGFRKKQFVEKKDGDSKEMGEMLNSEADVVRAGGTLDYKEWEHSKKSGGKPLRLFQPYATALILVEKPEHIPDEEHATFTLEFQGRWFTLVLWSMKGGSYTFGAKQLFTSRKMGKCKAKPGYRGWTWSLTTKLYQARTGNWSHIPVLRDGPKNSPEFVAFVEELWGSN